MSASNTSSVAVSPHRGEASTLEELVSLALAPRWRDRRYTLSPYATEMHLTATGVSRFARHTPHIVLRGEVARLVEAMWPRNKYHTCIGQKTLPRIVKALGGPDVSERIRAAMAAEKAKEDAARDWSALCNLARNLHTALYEKGPSAAFIQAQPAETRDALIAARVAMQNALDRLTRNEPAIALMVAYDVFGNPREQ